MIEDDFLDGLQVNDGPSEPLWKRLLEAADEAAAIGEDTPPNYDLALRLYDQAAQLGSAEALHRLGVMYRNGDGVSKSLSKAAEYLKQAAKGGIVDAYPDLAYLLDDAGRADDAGVCWDRFWEGGGAHPARAMMYAAFCKKHGRPLGHRKVLNDLLPAAQEIWSVFGVALRSLPQGREMESGLEYLDEQLRST